jgi:hypothetical protein
VSAVAEFADDKAVDCVVDATTKRLEATVVAEFAVVTAVANTDWFAKAVASAVDNVASKAVFAAELRARTDADVDAVAAVAVTADALVDACVLTFVVVYCVSPPVVATCAWALSTKAVVAAAATPVKRTIFLFNILQFLNYAIEIAVSVSRAFLS